MVKLTRLKDVRQRKALTQAQLAERAGVNRVTIARIEGGKDEPFPTTVRKVADALGVEPEELLGVEAEAPVNPAPSHARAAIVPLDNRITVQDGENVARLLQADPDLVPLVNEAVEQLTERIGTPDAQFSLRYMPDYEGASPGELLLTVSGDLDLEPKAAFALLRQFDREWWFHNARRGGGRLVVDLY